MTNLEKYINAFVESFGIERDGIEGLKYGSISQWDSIGHMDLIATLEDTFDIMTETDDILDFDSFEKGKEIMKKYGVDLIS